MNMKTDASGSVSALDFSKLELRVISHLLAQRIVYLDSLGEFSQDEIALQLGISRWKVRKALMEAKRTITQEDSDLLAVAKASGLTAQQLQDALAMPALTPENMKNHLLSMSQVDFMELFFNVAMYRAAEAKQKEQQEDSHVPASS